jgi:hypothetical protein
MTDLAFLHEPGVLWNLKQRYAGDAIYTYTGSILIAVNPFKGLPALYKKNVMDSYSSGDASGLPPHVYAVASAAYRKMRQEGRGQAILVRGWGVGGGQPGSCMVIGAGCRIRQEATVPVVEASNADTHPAQETHSSVASSQQRQWQSF